MKKRVLSLLCAGAMILGFSACGNSAEKSEYASQTLVGQVASVADCTLTLTLGELTQNEFQPHEDGNGENTGGPESGENGKNTGRPESGENGGMPQPPDGQAPSDGSSSGQPPQVPPDGQPSDHGQTLPDGISPPGKRRLHSRK